MVSLRSLFLNELLQKRRLHDLCVISVKRISSWFYAKLLPSLFFRFCFPGKAGGGLGSKGGIFAISCLYSSPRRAAASFLLQLSNIIVLLNLGF